MSKKRYIHLLVCLSVITVTIAACGKMYDNIDKYAGEVVYPGKFDTIVARIGYERVELDLSRAGRIPASGMNLGKAKKTVIEYDNVKIVKDSVVSWVNVTDLKQSKLYRIKVYTIDEFENKSVPQEIGVIPYTSSDLELLQMAAPRVLASPSTVALDWPTGLSSILSNYYGLSYSYKDRFGEVKTGERRDKPRIFMANLVQGEAAQIAIKYKVVPKVNNVPILDTVTLDQTLQINTPTPTTVFKPAEADILKANGVTDFTANGTASVQKLTFPVHTLTLQDIFYFPNVKEIDLTGGTLFQMKTNAYNRNSVTKTIGGGSQVSFARRVGDMPEANVFFLLDMLEAGQLTKVKYIPGSLGIDALLQPYVDKGIVELVPLPNDELIPYDRFFIDGRVQTAAFYMDPKPVASEYPAGTDLQNVFKGTILAKDASIVMMLPKEYEFNVSQYKYIRFKVYGPPKTDISNNYKDYQILWPRFMNYLWAFGTESTFGQQGWDLGKSDYKLPDAALQTWYDVRLDLSQAVGRHNRVLVLNIGGETSTAFTAPAQPIVFYFANFRFSKN
ncbi:DUF4998 domain-containing protein [Niabella drilacis]|uniref:Uncharacterized protein n=1 Tax=Niabella drilacis (strain DSM 25811 / CCM 8410 / CCUG 62505 / LMG 26954 / E90) TaxID=1285928 RepID=A0A1G7BEH9_NIADE|nr:DUF4998 domain-containing protein [Niabella drilacis]SDE25451.1 protein of unknown function [Niabella drilacis]